MRYTSSWSGHARLGTVKVSCSPLQTPADGGIFWSLNHCMQLLRQLQSCSPHKSGWFLSNPGIVKINLKIFLCSFTETGIQGAKRYKNKSVYKHTLPILRIPTDCCTNKCLAKNLPDKNVRDTVQHIHTFCVQQFADQLFLWDLHCNRFILRYLY